MMYSHEDKVRLLQKYAPSILREHEGSEFYVGAAIPPDIKEAVIESFLYSLDEQEILGVCKLAQLGSGGMGGMWGYFFTDTQACEYVGAEVSGSVVSYAEIKSMEITKGYRTDYARDLVFHMYDGSVVTWSCAYLNKTPLFEFFREMMNQCQKNKYGFFLGIMKTWQKNGFAGHDTDRWFSHDTKTRQRKADADSKQKLPYGTSHEDKVRLLQKYASEISGYHKVFYTGTDIPREQMKHVSKCFTHGLDQKTIIGVYEITQVRGDWGWGYCFTDTGVYEYLDDRIIEKPFRYDDIKKTEKKGDLVFTLRDGSVVIWSKIYLNEMPLFQFLEAMARMIAKNGSFMEEPSDASDRQKKPDVVSKRKVFKDDSEHGEKKEPEKSAEALFSDSKAVDAESSDVSKGQQQEQQQEQGCDVWQKNEDLVGISHIFFKNPVLKEEAAVKKAYFETLKKYVRLGGWEDGEYVKEQMNLYSHLFLSEETCRQTGVKPDMDAYRYFILLDICHILGFEKNLLTSDSMKKVTDEMISDFPCMGGERSIYSLILGTAGGSYGNWERLEKMAVLQTCREYIKAEKQNQKFWHTNPFRILVTATMSAGKSTFINCLAGKDVSLSQTTACTSRIHRVIGKVFDDGCSCKYDGGFNLMAQREELLYSDSDASDQITVSTCFNGSLCGERIEIFDSPGVNYSEDPKHKRMTQECIRAKNYDLLVYLMNATQLGTEDEAAHLDYVKSCIGDLPILFVINKIDCINGEEEDVKKIIRNQIRFLNEKGFSNPAVAPVSALAGYLAKCSRYGELSRTKTREFNNFFDKFEEMGLTDYYKRYYPGIGLYYPEQEAMQLLKNCGISYVEQIIKTWCEEGRLTEIQGLDARLG